MSVTIQHPSNKSAIDSMIEFINALIDCLKTENLEKPSKYVSVEKTLTPNFYACLKLRADRKQFERLVNDFLKDFQKLPEKKQSEIEMRFYNGIIKLESLTPFVKDSTAKRNLSLSHRLFYRELNKTLKVFRKAQKLMSDYLYPDNSQQILSNPVEYQKLVDFWGDLAD